MTHADLVARAVRWLSSTRHCSTVATRACMVVSEQPDAIGWKASSVSILVECKTSRADFFRDVKKPHRLFPQHGVGSERYYLTPPGLVKAEELPAGWGLLECHPRTIRVVVEAQTRSHKNRPEELRLLLGYIRRGGDVVEVALEEGCLPDVGL